MTFHLGNRLALRDCSQAMGPSQARIAGPPWSVQISIQSCNWVESGGMQCLTNPNPNL